MIEKADLFKVLELLPDLDIQEDTGRYEGKCPRCKADRLVSFLDQYSKIRLDRWVTCGYVCLCCHWSNAGERPIDEGLPDLFPTRRPSRRWER